RTGPGRTSTLCAARTALRSSRSVSSGTKQRSGSDCQNSRRQSLLPRTGSATSAGRVRGSRAGRRFAQYFLCALEGKAPSSLNRWSLAATRSNPVSPAGCAGGARQVGGRVGGECVAPCEEEQVRAGGRVDSAGARAPVVRGGLFVQQRHT